MVSQEKPRQGRIPLGVYVLEADTVRSTLELTMTNIGRQSQVGLTVRLLCITASLYGTFGVRALV